MSRLKPEEQRKQTAMVTEIQSKSRMAFDEFLSLSSYKIQREKETYLFTIHQYELDYGLLYFSRFESRSSAMSSHASLLS